MSAQASFKDIVLAGGPVLAGMAALSVYCVALIWERWRFFTRATAGHEHFLSRARQLAGEGKFNDAAALARAHRGLAGPVVTATLAGPSHRDDRRRAAERAVSRAVGELERGLSHLGTIAATAPFIGLFGTVLGVMRAFRDLAGAAGAGPGIVAVGISEALVCTAAGLLVAIPAVAAYNHFQTLLARFEGELSWAAEEILEGLSERAHR